MIQQIHYLYQIIILHNGLPKKKLFNINIVTHHNYNTLLTKLIIKNIAHELNSFKTTSLTNYKLI